MLLPNLSSTSSSKSFISLQTFVVLICCLTNSVLSSPTSPNYYNSSLIKRANNVATQLNLGAACSFSLVARSGISTSATARIQGDIALSPIAETGFTGGAPVDHGSPVEFFTDPSFTGRGYAADNANSPAPAAAYAAVAEGTTDPVSAYEQGLAQRVNAVAPNIDYQGGILGGPIAMQPGVYSWGGAVTIPVGATLTLNGNCGDVFVMITTGALSTGTMSNVVLTGGLTSASVFWIVTGAFTTGAAPSSFSGIVLSAGNMAVDGNLNGMLYTRTSIALGGLQLTRPASCRTPQGTCFTTPCDTPAACPPPPAPAPAGTTTSTFTTNFASTTTSTSTETDVSTTTSTSTAVVFVVTTSISSVSFCPSSSVALTVTSSVTSTLTVISQASSTTMTSISTLVAAQAPTRISTIQSATTTTQMSETTVTGQPSVSTLTVYVTGPPPTCPVCTATTCFPETTIPPSSSTPYYPPSVTPPVTTLLYSSASKNMQLGGSIVLLVVLAFLTL